MGGNLRLCSNTQKATPYRGGIQNSPSEKEWAVEKDGKAESAPKGKGRNACITRQAVLQFYIL